VPELFVTVMVLAANEMTSSPSQVKYTFVLRFRTSKILNEFVQGSALCKWYYFMPATLLLELPMPALE
jgi:hypothetical protein